MGCGTSLCFLSHEYSSPSAAKHSTVLLFNCEPNLENTFIQFWAHKLLHQACYWKLVFHGNVKKTKQKQNPNPTKKRTTFFSVRHDLEEFFQGIPSLSVVSQNWCTHTTAHFPQLCSRNRRSLDPKVVVKQHSSKIYCLRIHIKSKSAKKKAPQNIKPWKYSHSLFLLWFFDSLTVSEELWSLANCFLFPWSMAACCNHFLGLPTPPLFLTSFTFLVWGSLRDMETL